MESRAKLAGHPIHQMLIVFPLGLLATGTLFDVIYLFNDNEELIVFSYWAILAGIIGGLAAAVFGFIDWASIPSGTRAKKIGLWHGGGNAIIMVLFIIALLIRTGADNPEYDPAGLPVVLEIIATLAATVTGWLGGELVDRLGVGVDAGANLEAPSSLSGQPASASGRTAHVPSDDTRRRSV